MGKTTYLVKKDPNSTKEKVEWLLLSGKEFYEFVSSPEGKGRRFIQLVDDISYECEEIIIEASEDQYRKWIKERNDHRYREQAGKTITMFSLDAPMGENGLVLEDTIPDRNLSVEEIIIEKEEKGRLRNAIALLSFQEQMILEKMYLGEELLTQMELAAELGIAQSTLNYRIDKIFKKLRKVLG